MSAASKKIDQYIKNVEPWQHEIAIRLRKVVHKADPDIEEVIKWGSPAFDHNGLVCWFRAQKKWVVFTFHQGSLVPDKYKLFNHGPKNPRNRSMEFTSADQIQEKQLISYLKIAVDNNKKGKKVKINPSRNMIPMPADVRKAVDARGVMNAYKERPPYQRRDYMSWIVNAKREETKEKRLNIMLDELEAGGLYMGMKWGKKRS